MKRKGGGDLQLTASKEGAGESYHHEWSEARVGSKSPNSLYFTPAFPYSFLFLKRGVSASS
jgi:hypothetical protein